MIDSSVTSSLHHSLVTQLQRMASQRTINRLWVALSGGMDSVALLNGLNHTRHVWAAFVEQPSIFAVHVHHGLSAHADEWQRFCEQLCHSLQVTLVSERVRLSGTGSIEQQARDARYAVFEQQLEDGDVILLAHHENDQLETFFLRLQRGSGLQGLAAMPSSRPLGRGHLLRPWLAHTRQEIETYVNEHELTHVEDDSNEDDGFDRNWWRLTGLPSIAQRIRGFQQALAKTIDQLQEDKQVLDELLSERLTDYQCASPWVSHNGLNIEGLSQVHPALRNALIRAWLQRLGVHPVLAKKQLNALWQEVALAQTDAAPLYRWRDHNVTRHAGSLVYVPLEAWNAQWAPQPWAGESMAIGVFDLSVHPASADELGLKPGQFRLGHYEGQAKVKLLARPTKSLKKLFQEAEIPVWLRAQWPVLYDGEQVVAIPGMGVSEGHSVRGGWQINLQLNKN